VKRTCPNCGSSVDNDNEICPECGEPLAPEESSAQAPASASRTSSTADRAGGTVICQECGSTNPAGATECQVCGEELRPARAREPEPKRRPAAQKRKRPVWVDYLLAALGTVVIALVIFFVAKPKEQMGPAEPAQGQDASGLPPGHPSMDQATLSAAQNKQIADMTAKVEANPSDMTSKVQLANLLYDANRHQEALRYYREYLAAKPDDHDARTDMAYSLYETGFPDSAIIELKRVIKAVPTHQNAAYNLAMMYVAKKNRDSVIYWLRRVITIDSTSMQAQRATQLIQALEQAHGSQDGSASSGGL
jgi:ribosomal protein L40E